jgi:hypothetical protein
MTAELRCEYLCLQKNYKIWDFKKLRDKRKFIMSSVCAISGFYCETDETCAPLGYYAASSGNFLTKKLTLRPA